MNSPVEIPAILVPFVTLSYPTTSPKDPDSFQNSSYYKIGYLDLCIIVSFIAGMAIARDLTRIYVLEPFARWCLFKKIMNKKKTTIPRHIKANGSSTNGTANGHAVAADLGHRLTKKEERQLNRSVVRFAEQGWAFIYYFNQCCFGFVICAFSTSDKNASSIGVCLG